jgi:6-pyruvoyl-tetrahydropterin synthase
MLTINKRFSFSASHKCTLDNLSKKQNIELFGAESKGEYGHGHNFEIAFIFAGTVHPKTGMIMEFSQIKERINSKVLSKYDHRHLNEVAPFDKIIPTIENISYELLVQARKTFCSEPAQPIACHLLCSDGREATSYLDNKKETHWKKDLYLIVDAKDLLSDVNVHMPMLSTFNLRITIDVDNETDFQEQATNITIENWFKTVKYKDLGKDKFFNNNKQSLPFIAKYCFSELKKLLPIKRVKINFDKIFVQYNGDDKAIIGQKYIFYAVHKLGDDTFSEQEKETYYGKCRFRHGHDFMVESSIEIDLEADDYKRVLLEHDDVMRDVISNWDYKCLENETNDFKDSVSTGEVIIQTLAKKLQAKLDHNIYRLRLSETDNNRFCWRPN